MTPEEHMSRAFLKIVNGPKQGTNVPLPDDVPLVIGRKQGDLIIEDPLVSGLHARIVLREGVFVLQDLGSTNGTMVDGRLTHEAALRPGQEITVGSTRMILFQSTEEAFGENRRRSARNQLEIAWLLDEELIEVATGEQTGSPGDVIGQDLRLPPGMNAVLEVVAGQDAGKVFRFTRGNVTIGRHAGEVPLNDMEVSRRHSVIEVFGRDMVFLRDLGSTNGTYHNGRRVRVSQLHPGDTVGIGKTVLKLKVSR